MSNNTYIAAATTTLLAFGFACSSGGPTPPKPGSAAFSWQAAKENFEQGDYLRTVEHLDRVLRTDNEFAPKARVWRLVMAAGLADAYRELTEQYEQGGRTNKGNSTPFRRKAVDYRTLAERSAMNLNELYTAFEKAQPDGDVAIPFGYPSRGVLSNPAAITKIAQGQIPGENDILAAQSGMVQKNVLANVCDVMGGYNDSAKTQQLMKEVPSKAPRGAFEMAMAESLYQSSVLFNPQKGSQPVRQRQLLDNASNALAKATGDEKRIKEIKQRIERDRKELAKKS
ncbi:MAG: hypothetical protein IT168_06560 [Bryobacterales bacterium]|nr:hypothetical protein [Bryobacterales bacterium]